MSIHVVLASAGPLADVISLSGLVAVASWIGWRFGPALARMAGWGWWWGAWACGSQGGYGYCAALLVLGTLSWAGGTVWYAKRRGHWPSAISARLFTRLLSRRKRVAHISPPSAPASHPRR